MLKSLANKVILTVFTLLTFCGLITAGFVLSTQKTISAFAADTPTAPVSANTWQYTPEGVPYRLYVTNSTYGDSIVLQPDGSYVVLSSNSDDVNYGSQVHLEFGRNDGSSNSGYKPDNADPLNKNNVRIPSAGYNPTDTTTLNGQNIIANMNSDQIYNITGVTGSFVAYTYSINLQTLGDNVTPSINMYWNDGIQDPAANPIGIADRSGKYVFSFIYNYVTYTNGTPSVHSPVTFSISFYVLNYADYGTAFSLTNADPINGNPVAIPPVLPTQFVYNFNKDKDATLASDSAYPTLSFDATKFAEFYANIKDNRRYNKHSLL